MQPTTPTTTTTSTVTTLTDAERALLTRVRAITLAAIAHPPVPGFVLGDEGTGLAWQAMTSDEKQTAIALVRSRHLSPASLRPRHLEFLLTEAGEAALAAQANTQGQ